MLELYKDQCSRIEPVKMFGRMKTQNKRKKMKNKLKRGEKR
jgi:hypothetical protein